MGLGTAFNACPKPQIRLSKRRVRSGCHRVSITNMATPKGRFDRRPDVRSPALRQRNLAFGVATRRVCGRSHRAALQVKKDGRKVHSALAFAGTLAVL